MHSFREVWISSSLGYSVSCKHYLHQTIMLDTTLIDIQKYCQPKT
jgi:hypothetical protein